MEDSIAVNLRSQELLLVFLIFRSHTILTNFNCFFISSRRLEVSRVELLLQVGAFCVAVGALVAGMPFNCNKKIPRLI